jgi:hypothetical protein
MPHVFVELDEPEFEPEPRNDSSSSAPQEEEDPDSAVPEDVIRLVSLDPVVTDQPGLDRLSIGGKEGDDTPIKGITPSAQEVIQAAQAPTGANETIPNQSNKQLWQVAAVVLTLTTASVLLRQIQNRAKANTTKLAALKNLPFTAAVPRKTVEGAYVILEQLGDNAELRILQEPTQGKLTKGEKSYIYQPDTSHGDSNNEDSFTYATPSGTGEIKLQLQTEAGQRKIAHALHDTLPNHAPVRLTIKAAKDAPTLIITDQNQVNEGKAIVLPTFQAAAHDPATVLSIALAQLPQGGTVSDSKNTFTVTETSAIDVTDWNLSTLTFLPPANFNGGFTLNIRVMENPESGTEAVTSASIKISAIQGNGSKRRPVSPASTSNAMLHASTKTASITVHSVLPDPDAKPKEMETRYHVINLASSHPRQSEPRPVIDWTGKVPDREISSMGWMPQLFASTKEKVRSLADITGLFFPYNREEER